MTIQPTPNTHHPLQLWVLTDQKPGHLSQLQGLVGRLSVHANVDIHWINAGLIKPTRSQWLRGRWPEKPKRTPDIIIGAGSATHTLLLLARRAFACMAVVVMRPSLPLFLFDAAIVPRHDRPPVREHVLITQGVMNTVTPRQHNAKAELHTLLIGGISKHFEWSSERVVTQIKEIVAAQPDVEWTLTNSRRTPEDFKALMLATDIPQVHFFPHDLTPRGWLAQQLGNSCEVWVTPDSVSMVYEAITAGAATGLFQLKPLQQGRIHEGLKEILTLHLYTPFERWQKTGELNAPKTPLWEAERGAVWLLEQYRQWDAGKSTHG